ncbi:MAG TPA: acetate--CoA ligase family protein [Candidatus Acidoferrales bacterium]|nr:acetate--CoA ligase family protein [Candidatus Acidoferrales bacterium]
MDDFFYPRSIAVIGAARESGKVGHAILKNLLDAKFQGEIIPINPNTGEILGLTAYPTIRKVDLAIIVVPARIVPSVLEDSGRVGVKAAIIISAGFRESGAHGALLEAQIRGISKRYNIRVIGPNCLGVISTAVNVNASFASEYPSKGGISLISQSGAICTAFLDWAASERLGFDKFVSVGNKADVSEAELVEYIARDPSTRVVSLYVEGIDNGRDFVNVAKEASRMTPLIALKAGRTDSGARAASSHTGALAGSDAVYDAAFKQAGIIRVHSIDEFFEAAKAFSRCPIPKSPGAAIVTNAGGLGVLASDASAEFGVPLANFTKDTIEALENALPEESNIYNPIDILGDANPQRYVDTLKIVLADQNVGLVVVLLSPQAMTEPDETANLLVELSSQTTKPMMTSFVGGRELSQSRERLRQSETADFPSPENAVRAASHLIKFREIATSERPELPPSIGVGQRPNALRRIQQVQAEGRTSLTEEEGKDILRAYGIKTPSERLVASRHKVVEAARAIGYPVALKVNSPDIFHKTDVGGVITGINTDKAAKNAFDQIYANINRRMPKARIEGVTVQKMVHGEEVIVGVTRDPQFGPFATFGLGGLYVEVLKDVSHRLSPMTLDDAKQMITEIKSYPILLGARGRKAVDIDTIASIILCVSRISQDFPEIQEIEINPLVVQEEGCVAVDALVVINGGY